MKENTNAPYNDPLTHPLLQHTLLSNASPHIKAAVKPQGLDDFDKERIHAMADEGGAAAGMFENIKTGDLPRVPEVFEYDAKKNASGFSWSAAWNKHPMLFLLAGGIGVVAFVKAASQIKNRFHRT